jgi:Subtilase family
MGAVNMMHKLFTFGWVRSSTTHGGIGRRRMTSRIFALGAVAAFAAISAVSAIGPVQPRLHVNSPGIAKLQAFGSRSAQQRASATGSKFDAALADIARHLNRVRPDHALADLHALNPVAKFIQPADSAGPLVSIDAITLGDPERLKSALVALGLQHAGVYSNDVGGWLPVSQLDAATSLSELHAIRAAMSRTRTGAVTSQGDFAQHSDTVRSANALTGAGVTVGVLSDSFDCYAQYAAPNSGVPASGYSGYAYNGFTATAATDVSTGDLPSTVNVLEEAPCFEYGAPILTPLGDEGRAMLQIVHDVAPGASLAFYTADNSEQDFAAGIGKLATAGATVIADDVGYFDEPFFQDGLVAQAIDAVQAKGVAYFSAAGNNSDLAYDNNAPSFTVAGSGATAGEHLLTFGTTGGNPVTSLPVTIPPMLPGEFVAIVLEWDQPYVTGAPNSGGATNQIDLCVLGVGGTDVLYDDNLNTVTTTCTSPNSLGVDPVQVLLIANPATNANPSSAENISIVVGLAAGTAPGRIKVVVEDDGLGSTITNFATNSATIQGHPGAAGAMAIGAAFFLTTPACGTTPPTLELFSSLGGDPILFDVNGVRLAAPVMRQKPDFVGPDGGNDTFLGFTLASQGILDNSMIAGCENNAAYPNFFGTSAATPHLASIAALFLQENPALTLTELYNAVSETALPINGAAPNVSAGWGLVQADAAEAKITPALPAAPTLALGANSIVVGNSTSLTWSSANNTGCTASATWTGAEPSSGMQTLSPATAGSYPYSLVCTNRTGTSAAASVTLTVTATAPPPASGGSGGGGALGLTTLLGLCAMCLARARRWLRIRPRGAVRLSANV